MKDQDKTKQQLIHELEELRRGVPQLEARQGGTGDERRRWDPSDSLWRSFLDGTQLFILVLDRDCRIRFANHTDSGATSNHIIGKALYDFCRPEDRESVRECVERVFVAGESGVCEGPGLRLDEEEHWYASHFGPILEDGKVVAVSVISVNVTDRKRAEQALQASEERFRKVFEEGPIGVALVGLDTRIQHVNRRFCEMLGYSEDEILALGIQGITHPDDFELDQQLAMRVWRGEIPSYTIDKRYIRKDGKAIWGRLTVSMMHDADGTPTIGIGMIEDVTDRKRAEEELAKSKAMLLAAVDCLPFNFFALGLDGRYTLQNAVSKAQHGADVIGKRPEEVCPNEHDLAVWLDNNRRAFAGEKVEGEVALSLGGEERFYYNVIAPIRDGEELYGILGVNIDITERKRAEEALQKAREELEQRVEERTAELRKANEDLAVFRRFAEASGQGFGMADMDGFITYLNPALCRFVGVARPEDTIGKHLSTYYPEGYMLKREAEILPALLRKGRWEGELVGSLGGKVLTVLQHSFLILDENGNPSRLASVITDITERKRVEKALRESEERLRMAIAATKDAIWDCNLLDGTVSWNDNYATSFGRPHETNGDWQWWIDHIHPEDRDRVVSSLKNAIEGSLRFWTAEYRYMRADGIWADILDRAYIAYTDSGKASRIVGAMLDITERKAAQEALRRSEERFRSYFVQGLVGMAVTGIDKQWWEVNDRLCGMLGYSREELLGMKWTDATHPNDLEAGQLLFNRMIAGEIEHYTQDKRFIRKDGEIAYATVFIRCFRSKDGAVDHILALIEDTTDRKRAEAALRQSEERYRAVVQDQTEVICRLKADGTYDFVNEVFCRFFGKTSQELLGHKWQPAVVGQDLPLVEEQLRALSTSTPIAVIENRIYSGLGEVRWMQFVNRGFFDQEGQLTEVQSVGRDITERKQAQEALENEHRTLKHLLQSSDHERQVIAYEIHDGLAQQLAGAIMQFDAYAHQKDSKPKLAVKAFDAGMTMLRQGHFEARRLISGVRPPILDEAGIVAAISHLVNEERRKKGPNIEYLSHVAFERLTPILENAIYRIVQEGLSNACEHSKSETIRVELVQQVAQVRIEVQDWGVGFNAEDIEDGHFGVAGIRVRARLLGGSAVITSEPGKGTRILVELPIVQRRAEDD